MTGIGKVIFLYEPDPVDPVSGSLLTLYTNGTGTPAERFQYAPQVAGKDLEAAALKSLEEILLGLPESIAISTYLTNTRILQDVLAAPTKRILVLPEAAGSKDRDLAFEVVTIFRQQLAATTATTTVHHSHHSHHSHNDSWNV